MPIRDIPNSVEESPRLCEVLDKNSELLDSIENKIDEIGKIMFGFDEPPQTNDGIKNPSYLIKVGTEFCRLRDIETKLTLLLQRL